MARQHKIISDLSGKELKDYVIVSVEKPGYNIKLQDGSVTNRAIFELEDKEIASMLRTLVYEPLEVPGRHP